MIIIIKQKKKTESICSNVAPVTKIQTLFNNQDEFCSTSNRTQTRVCKHHLLPLQYGTQRMEELVVRVYFFFLVQTWFLHHQGNAENNDRSPSRNQRLTRIFFCKKEILIKWLKEICLRQQHSRKFLFENIFLLNLITDVYVHLQKICTRRNHCFIPSPTHFHHAEC